MGPASQSASSAAPRNQMTGVEEAEAVEATTTMVAEVDAVPHVEAATMTAAMMTEMTGVEGAVVVITVRVLLDAVAAIKNVSRPCWFVFLISALCASSYMPWSIVVVSCVS